MEEVQVRFKNDRVEKEWESMKLDFRLVIIVGFIDWWCKKYVNRIDGKKKDIQITCIYRTQSEQEAIYGKGTKKLSTHQYWRAVDIGVNAFSTETKKELVDILNLHLKNMGNSKVCVWHNIGLGDHFHIQVGSGEHSKIIK